MSLSLFSDLLPRRGVVDSLGLNEDWFTDYALFFADCCLWICCCSNLGLWAVVERRSWRRLVWEVGQLRDEPEL